MASDERRISRAKAAAGIMLDVYTDSTTLSFEAVLPASPCFFDVYIIAKTGLSHLNATVPSFCAERAAV